MKLSTAVPAAIAIVLIVLFVKVMIPLSTSRENSVPIKGSVSKVMAGGMKDITISLFRVDGLYYISKGVERGLNVDSLSAMLVNKQVTILYQVPGFFGKLVPQQSPRSINELKLGDKVIFSEFKNSP
jgi:hypothetical protein